MFTLYKLDVLDIPTEGPFVETLEVNNNDIQFEVDTACGVSVEPYGVHIFMGRRCTRITAM